MTSYKGIGGSPGYGCGIAAVKRNKTAAPEKYAIDDTMAEIKRFRDAQASCDKRINEIMNNSGTLNDKALGIFRAYLAILHDEVFFKRILSRLEIERLNMEHLIYIECQSVMDKFTALDDPYLRERAADIENICNEIIRSMLGLEQDFIITEGSDTVIIAHDLTPIETVKMNKSCLRGFVTEKSGATSHSVILAKTLGIPAITGVAGIVEMVSNGDFVLLDAFSGIVTVNPDSLSEAQFRSYSESYAEKQRLYAKHAGLPAVTLDGHTVHVNINTGDSDSIKNFDAKCCDGIGLFRTEFLYMDRGNYPSEEIQYAVYSDLAAKAQGKEVIIRTLDIGGDKQVSYMNLPREENPFLGYRAIRICLDRREIFHTQLRAILRASVHGNVKIMFPMIINLEELMEAKSCVEQAKRSLSQDGIPFYEDISVGIMVETPAATLISDKLAKESDFFSIGSNDLIQYITATDRMNERVHYLYDSCNLSVLRAIRMVAENAAAAGIPWGICGEVASEERLISAWVALGVSELSVAPSLVGRIKHLVRRMSKETLLPQINRALDLSRAEEVRSELDKILALAEL